MLGDKENEQTVDEMWSFITLIVITAEVCTAEIRNQFCVLLFHFEANAACLKLYINGFVLQMLQTVYIFTLG